MLTWIEPHQRLPSPRRALREPNGLLAAGRDLSPARLLEAYRKGIFPWYGDGQPVLWWSPDPRMVLFPEEFAPRRSLVKTLRRLRRDGTWRLSLDEAFADVMRACAEPRPGQDGTWITDDIRAAYVGLHGIGHAHSVEVWEGEALIGGLYGVAIGRMFYGESMFARRTDASKCAFSALVALLREQGFSMIDCQQATSHLASLGARQIARSEFLERVTQATKLPEADWQGLSIDFPDVQAPGSPMGSLKDVDRER
jgi:leucyl/phenylalanyl-tRNA---protein transferase